MLIHNFFSTLSLFNDKVYTFILDGDDVYDRDVGGYSSEPDPSLLGDTDKVSSFSYWL